MYNDGGHYLVSFRLKFGTSEAIRDKTKTTHTRYIESISEHNNKHFNKPRNIKDLECSLNLSLRLFFNPIIAAIDG
jgi:hypothetical protein